MSDDDNKLRICFPVVVVALAVAAELHCQQYIAPILAAAYSPIYCEHQWRISALASEAGAGDRHVRVSECH